MFLKLSKEAFKTHLSKYFTEKYNEIRKNVSLCEPILNLVSAYNQYRILSLMYEKDYRTGMKVIQKG